LEVKFLSFYKYLGFVSIAICCPVSEKRFIGFLAMVEGNSYISKFMILSLNWKKPYHLYIEKGPVLKPFKCNHNQTSQKLC